VLARCARALTPDGVLLLFDERYPSGPGELRDPTEITEPTAPARSGAQR
jgi:hypothetical protein